MKVKNLYNLTKELMFEKPSSTIYDNYLIGNLNRILIELFDENNMCRISKGFPPLVEPQIIESTNYNDIELEYEPEYVYNVIPLGLAARFLIDDDLNKYSIFNADYNNARVIAQRFVSKRRLDAIS